MSIDRIQSLEESLKSRLGSDAEVPFKGNFTSVNGLDVLLQDMQTLLLTIPGERVNRPEYGSGLKSLVWENVDDASSQGIAIIRSALNQFEPRVNVTSVESNINRNTGLITFIIRFVVKSTDTAANLIFPLRTSSQISSQ